MIHRSDVDMTHRVLVEIIFVKDLDARPHSLRHRFSAAYNAAVVVRIQVEQPAVSPATI